MGVTCQMCDYFATSDMDMVSVTKALTYHWKYLLANYDWKNIWLNNIIIVFPFPYFHLLCCTFSILILKDSQSKSINFRNMNHSTTTTITTTTTIRHPITAKNIFFVLYLS